MYMSRAGFFFLYISPVEDEDWTVVRVTVAVETTSLGGSLAYR